MAPRVYEQGHRQSGYAKLRRLAELYGCTVDDFFTDAPEPAARGRGRGS